MVPELPGNEAQKAFCHGFYCRKYCKNSSKLVNRTYFMLLFRPKGDTHIFIYLFIEVLGPEIELKAQVTNLLFHSLPLTLEVLNVDFGVGVDFSL